MQAWGGGSRRVFTQPRQKSELKSGFIVMEMWQVGAFEEPVMGPLRSESSFSEVAADTWFLSPAGFAQKLCCIKDFFAGDTNKHSIPSVLWLCRVSK